MRERLEFNPDIINGFNVYDFTTEKAWIASGVDSQVFHHRDWVLKKYNARGPSIKQLLLYQEVTNMVANLIGGRTANIGFLGKITLRAEPIIRVFESDKNRQAFSISRYVGGKRLKEGQNNLFDQFLEAVSLEIRRTTGYKGIDLCAPNTKLQKTNWGIGPFTNNICIVTDICRYIETLSK